MNWESTRQTSSINCIAKHCTKHLRVGLCTLVLFFYQGHQQIWQNIRVGSQELGCELADTEPEQLHYSERLLFLSAARGRVSVASKNSVKSRNRPSPEYHCVLIPFLVHVKNLNSSKDDIFKEKTPFLLSLMLDFYLVYLLPVCHVCF